MGVDIIAQLSRKNGANFPLVAAEDIIGTFAVVASTAARDAIPTNILRTGAVVRIGASASYYQWNGAAWVSYTLGGGGAGVVQADGSVPFTADQSMGGHKLTNVAAGAGGTDAVNKTQLDAVDTAALKKDGTVALTADWAAGAHDITVTQDPGSANALTRKSYVDALVSGLIVRPSVLAVATANVASLTGLAQTFDGVALNTDGQRVLLTAQTTGSQNGPWIVHSGAWTRPADFAAGSDAASAYFFVQQGTTYSDTGWVCTSNSGSAVVGTNNLAFVQFSSAGVIVDDGSTTQKTGNTLAVRAGGLTNTQVNASAAIAGTKIAPDFGAQTVRSTAQFVGASTGTPTALSDAGSFESCTTSSGTRGLVHRQASADTNGAGVFLQKCRGTHAAPAAHNADDHLGFFACSGHDGSAFYTAGVLRFVADAAGGTSKRTRFESLIHNGVALVTGEKAVQATVTTTNATLTTVYSIAIGNDEIDSISIRWVGKQQSSSNRAVRETSVTVRRSGSGNVVELSSNDATSLFRDDATWGDATQITYTLNNTTKAVDITVQGKASTSIDWVVDVTWATR